MGDEPSNAISVVTPENRLAAPNPVARFDIVAIVQAAIASGRPMSEMKEALDLAERMEAIRRETLFNEAFTAFKRDCPPTPRRTQDEYITVTRNGTRKPRMYASLDDISANCDPHLHGHGLTYEWTSAEVTPTGSIIRRFVLRHVAGHSRPPVASPPIPIEGGADYKAISGGRKETSASPQQRLGVADTYAKRYSMTAGLGIPTCDEDDDAGGPGIVTGDKLSDDQRKTILDLLIEVKADDKARVTFAQGYGVQTIGDIPAVCFGPACERLNRQIRKAAK